MKTKWTLTLLSLAVACGNPHISSLKTGIERITPPIAQEACEAPHVTVSDYLFFTSSEMPADYANFIKCKTVINEGFNGFNNGSVPVLTNEDNIKYFYVLTHRSEIEHASDKVIHIEEIFGEMTYDFSVNQPVTNNGDVSVDRGVNSGSVSYQSKDAFVWKFTSPVSFWGARPVGLKDNSTLRIYNCDEELLDEALITGNPEFIGFVTSFENICYVSLSAADGTDAVAIDEFEYGY